MGHMPVQALYLRGSKRQARDGEKQSTLPQSRIYEDATRLPTYCHIGTSNLLSLLRRLRLLHWPSIWDQPTNSLSTSSRSPLDLLKLIKVCALSLAPYRFLLILYSIFFGTKRQPVSLLLEIIKIIIHIICMGFCYGTPVTSEKVRA